jgi:hypothetical protein
VIAITTWATAAKLPATRVYKRDSSSWSAPFEQVAAHLASQLAVPCEFLIFRKRLAEARAMPRTRSPER